MDTEQLSLAVIAFVESHLLQPTPMERVVEDTIKASIEGLEETKKAFKSKQVAKVKKDLESLLK